MFPKLTKENAILCELGLSYGRKLSQLRFETHAVMHLSQSKYQLLNSHALTAKGEGRWNGRWFICRWFICRWFIARYAQNTPTGFRPTRFRFASGARVSFPPS